MTLSSVIIPVREFGAGKLRLRSVLSDEKRKSLSMALLGRVLSAMDRSDVERIVVVASDKDEISKQYDGYSKLSLISETIHHGGVNSAVRDALDYLKNGSSSKTLITPSDLPMINHQRVNEALKLMERYELIINPSLKKDGTNLLGITNPSEFVFHYDDDSYNRHLAEAESHHMNYVKLDWNEFSFDIDDADDLEMLIDIHKTTSFDELLRKISSLEEKP